jgi:hypothetical protein
MSARHRLAGVALIAAGLPAAAMAQSAWPVHSLERPEPAVVAPAPAGPPSGVPGDAIVLFDGNGLGAWEGTRGGPARWQVTPGFFEVLPESGTIRTREAFGDVQLHIEWRAPLPAEGEGQNRGNSGVFLMGRYEIQVLDSWRNRTYADGQAAAVYGQHPPLVNASRPPGEWQSYDIVFRRPRFANGRVVSPAIVTLFHNGVLVHDGAELTGPVSHGRRSPYQPHADQLPLALQDHGQRVRFRNVWVRRLEEASGER